MNDTVIIICTRPKSKRIHEKVFRNIAGVRALDHILKRIENCGLPIILATDGDPRYKEFLGYKNTHVYEGNPLSPLHRMVDALDWFSLEKERFKYVVRITHDDILIDAEEMIGLLNTVRELNFGYGVSDGIIEGAGVEVISVENLLYAENIRKEPTEFISYFVRGLSCPNPCSIRKPPRESIRRNYRLTMDYMEDAFVLETILRKLGAFASNDDICKFIDENPHIMNINKLPEVSLYTCAYNAEKWVSELIPNIKSNLNTSCEYIVIEDCSRDNTLSELVKVCDGSFNLTVNDGNLGLSNSSNIALDRCRGKYVMRVDADDIIKIGSLEKMIYRIKKDKSAIVYSGYDELGGSNRKNIDPRENHHAGCALMDRSMLNEIRFTDGLRHWDSLDLYQRIKKHNFPISYIDSPLWYYRRHDKSLSQDNSKLRMEIYKNLTSNSGN